MSELNVLQQALAREDTNVEYDYVHPDTAINAPVTGNPPIPTTDIMYQSLNPEATEYTSVCNQVDANTKEPPEVERDGQVYVTVDPHRLDPPNHYENYNFAN